MWTTPPPDGSDDYLTAARESEGMTIADNMTPSPRYCAIDNDIWREPAGAVTLSVPGIERAFPSILFESLATSIQPIQIPDVEVFPRYYNTAIRTLGPVLALATNSPLLPPDLYEIDDPSRLLEETYHELRIPVFETIRQSRVGEGSLPERNPADGRHRRQARRRPDVCAVSPRVARRRYSRDVRGPVLGTRSQAGTYWRWLRAVIGGQPVKQRDHWSVRIEYRPLPTQPTIAENIGFRSWSRGWSTGCVRPTIRSRASIETSPNESFYAAVGTGSMPRWRGLLRTVIERPIRL